MSPNLFSVNKPNISNSAATFWTWFKETNLLDTAVKWQHHFRLRWAVTGGRASPLLSCLPEVLPADQPAAGGSAAHCSPLWYVYTPGKFWKQPAEREDVFTADAVFSLSFPPTFQTYSDKKRERGKHLTRVKDEEESRSYRLTSCHLTGNFQSAPTAGRV